MSSPYQSQDPYYGQHNPYANGQQYPHGPGGPYGSQGQPGQHGTPPPGYHPGLQQPVYAAPVRPGPPQRPQPGEPNQLALASVVVGFISIVGSLFCYGGLLGPVGIGLGIAGVNRARTTGVGRNQSLGGIALGTLGTAIGTAFIALVVVYQKKTMMP